MLKPLLMGTILSLCLGQAANAQLASPKTIDDVVTASMQATGAQGMAVAVIDDGKVVYVKSFGYRNLAHEPLQNDTVMYGASLTKTVFAALVLDLAEEGKVKLDTPIAAYLDRPLPDYPDEDKYAYYSDLKDDARWQKLTPRMLLSHASGFANYGFLEPDQKLKFHFEPGARYAYSGDGIILLQFILERGLGLDVQDELQRRYFTPLNMNRTSLIWRDDFRPNLADGWKIDGQAILHDERSNVRASGSMDTTISDLANFFADLMGNKIISPQSLIAMSKGDLKITTKTQFPTLQAELPSSEQHKNLYAGIGVIVFNGPQGKGFFKGGHDDITANTVVCINAKKRCLLILSNDVRSERAFPYLVRRILGETGVPYNWEYGF